MSAHARKLVKRVVLGVAAAAAAATLVSVLGLSPSPALASPPDPTTCTEALAAGLLPLPPTDSRVTLCHFTGSASNPFIINQPSLSAALTHAGHHDDCVKYFDGTTQCGL